MLSDETIVKYRKTSSTVSHTSLSEISPRTAGDSSEDASATQPPTENHDAHWWRKAISMSIRHKN